MLRLPQKVTFLLTILSNYRILSAQWSTDSTIVGS